MAAKKKVTTPKEITAIQTAVDKPATVTAPAIDIANQVLNEVEGLLGNFVGENAKDESNCFSNKVCKKDWSKLRLKYVI